MIFELTEEEFGSIMIVLETKDTGLPLVKLQPLHSTLVKQYQEQINPQPKPTIKTDDSWVEEDDNRNIIPKGNEHG